MDHTFDLMARSRFRRRHRSADQEQQHDPQGQLPGNQARPAINPLACAPRACVEAVIMR
jgi:hypothetical protein